MESASKQRSFCHEDLEDLVLSRSFQHEWPSKSLDLTLCDFLVMGIIKVACVQRSAYGTDPVKRCYTPSHLKDTP